MQKSVFLKNICLDKKTRTARIVPMHVSTVRNVYSNIGSKANDQLF